MARLASPSELALLASAGYKVVVKVEIEDGDFVFRDYRNQAGGNWIIGGSIDHDIDQPVAQATVQLWRQHGAIDSTLSLSPIRDDSTLNRRADTTFAPAIDVGRRMRISTACVALGSTPTGGEWKIMFEGEIDVFQFDQPVMTVTARDDGGRLVDGYFNQARTFKMAATPIEDVITTILDDLEAEASIPPVSLVVPASPSYDITSFKYDLESGMDALQRLVQVIGWDLRYRWNETAGAFQFTLQDPGRGKTTPDRILAPAQILKISELKIDRTNLRNIVDVYYGATIPGTDRRIFQSASDADSITKYGTRRMALQESSDSAIGTADEATAMAQYAVADLKDPKATHAAELFYDWTFELQDLIRFTANGNHYNSDQDFGVRTLRHVFTGGDDPQARTLITCGGGVTGAYRQWIARSRKSVAPSANDPRRAILRVSPAESSDGTAREFTVLVGSLVATVHVHYRTVPIDSIGDAFDFSDDADVVADDRLLILRVPPTDPPTVSFSLPHPPRGYRLVGRMVPRGAAPEMAEGESWPFTVDAAPPAVTAKIHPLRSGTTANLSIDILFGVSDGPVTVDVFEDSGVATTTLLTKTMTAPGTIDSGTDAALGNRTLPPGKDSLAWRVRITDVNGQPYWSGPASANRDPLPNGAPAVKNYRATPAIVCPFDPDTDQIRYTAHNGKTKTYDAAALAASGSPITYTVGDALDDASTEAALAVDELRTAAKVEYQGGGTWLEMWRGDLHGQPSNPPTADVRADPNANRDACDVRIRPDTQVDEQLHVYWRDGATDAALEWIACVSAGDPTPLAVTAGTQLGPSNFFRRVDGVGSPVAKLSAIPALRDQVGHYGVMIEGVDSGMQSPWLDVTISIMEKPWNESFVLEWDDAAGAIVAIVAAGAHTLFETVQVADNNLFSSPTTQTAVIADGTVAKLTFPLSQAQRGKLWYGRAKPNNKNDGTGLDGEYQSGSVAVPALFTVDPSTSETASQGTLTFVVSDPGQVLDPNWTNGSITTPIHYEVLRLGVKTTEAPTTSPGGGSTTGTFTKTITLLDHPVTIGAYAHLRDGSKRALGAWTFDSNKVADLKDSNVVDNGQNAEVTLTWDTDALVGSNCARYSLNNGASWTTVTISSGLLSQFTVARTSTTQQLLVQALNAIDGNWGTQSTVKVSAYLTEGPSLSVYVTPGTTQYTITWTGTGTITVSIDGGAYATASSPITRFRDASDHTYDFLAVQGGQSLNPPSIVVPALASSGGATAIAITKPTISVNTSSDTFTFSFGASPLPSGYYFTVVWHDTNAHTIDAFSLSSPTSSPVILTTSDHGYNLVAGSTYQLTGHVEAYDGSGNLRGVSQDATVNFNAL